VIPNKLTNEGIVNDFVLHLRFLVLFLVAIADVVVVVEVATDIEVPLDVDFEIRIVRNFLFVFTKLFVD